eukprot:scaffold8966_cov132-Isochrysis_galbana.AAC.1
MDSDPSRRGARGSRHISPPNLPRSCLMSASLPDYQSRANHTARLRQARGKGWGSVFARCSGNATEASGAAGRGGANHLARVHVYP